MAISLSTGACFGSSVLSQKWFCRSAEWKAGRARLLPNCVSPRGALCYRCAVWWQAMSDRAETERILDVLRPYAANWTGSLGRGDLVVPQREIPRLIQEILRAVREMGEGECEVTE